MVYEGCYITGGGGGGGIKHDPTFQMDSDCLSVTEIPAGGPRTRISVTVSCIEHCVEGSLRRATAFGTSESALNAGGPHT
jgi:hypothetical protein